MAPQQPGLCGSLLSRFKLDKQPGAPPASPKIETDLFKLKEQLWNEAYDALKERDPGLVNAYEKLLTVKLDEWGATITGNQNIPQYADNKIGQTQKKRSSQMSQLARAGYEYAKEVAKTKRDTEMSLRITNDNLKSTVRESMASKAALVGVAICLGLEILYSTRKEPSLNRRGLTHVLLRMPWFWVLPRLLLVQNKDPHADVGLQAEMKDHVVDLYEEVLLYLVRMVWLFHRSGALAFYKHLVPLDWNSQPTEIVEIAALVDADSEKYNSQEIKSGIEKTRQSLAVLDGKFSEVRLKRRDQIMSKDEDKACLQALVLTDPGEDRLRIQESKGGLLGDSYRWIAEDAGYKRFLGHPGHRLLWVSGPPGQGKTMLMCGVVEKLGKTIRPLSYFFCQAAQADQSSDTAVLRGLIYLLIQHSPSLIRHVRPEYDNKGRKLFDGINSSVALSTILEALLQDMSLRDAVLVVDAIDECTTGRDRLVNLIIKLSLSCHAKWIISSRNSPQINDQLRNAHKLRIQLELNKKPISMAVKSYVQQRVDDLASAKSYRDALKDQVSTYLLSNAGDTFLWVAFVCQRLAEGDVRKFNTLAELGKTPSGLVSFYRLMQGQVSASPVADLLNTILAATCGLEGPVTKAALKTLVGACEKLEDDELEELINSCGSFLTCRDGVVEFVHPSAREFLLEEGQKERLGKPNTLRDDEVTEGI